MRYLHRYLTSHPRILRTTHAAAHLTYFGYIAVSYSNFLAVAAGSLFCITVLEIIHPDH